MQRIHFNKENHQAFKEALHKEVAAYFVSKKTTPYASQGLWIKMILLLLMYIGAYLSLFLFDLSNAGMYGIAILMGLLMCCIGFNISHQAAHGALSKNPTINRIMGLSFNLMGMSDYIWMLKHNVSHHAYTNIYENDEALKEDETLRLSPEAPWKPIHRWQHWYTPFVYAVFTIFWATLLDIDKLRRYHAWGAQTPKKHPVKEVLLFWCTKLFFVTVYIVCPLMFLPISLSQFLIGFLTFQAIGSLLITHILQVEHLNEKAILTSVPEDGKMEVSWFVNQLQGTANFRIQNRLFQWFIGPVNYQIEHHLFPHIAGNHLPAISKIVEKTAIQHGLPYNAFPSFYAALVSHYSFLKTMSQKPVAYLKSEKKVLV